MLAWLNKVIIIIIIFADRTNLTRREAVSRITIRTTTLVILKPVFHFARIVAKRTGEHAQIEKRFIKPRISGCIRVSK
jgi:hypothetical protein